MSEAVTLARAEKAALSYEARKQGPRCTRCERKAKDDSQYCVRCHREQKRLKRESWARKYEKRLAANLCVRCPGDDPNPATEGSTACLGCRIKRNRVKISDGGLDVDLERAARIAAATSRDIEGRNGRVRYRGQQKRGQQPKYQLNVQDLRHVKEDFTTFERAINILAKPETQQMHASDRVEVERNTAEVGERMIRRTGDILERLGHFKERHGPRPGESAAADIDPDSDGTLNYKRPSDASKIAAAATPGVLIYAPPLDVTSGRRETGKDSRPPDLAPLRAALAARGLGLVDEDAYYWRVVTTKKNGE